VRIRQIRESVADDYGL